jgi:hypothetical protein
MNQFGGAGLEDQEALQAFLSSLVIIIRSNGLLGTVWKC